jgi:hypothetical protein
MYEKNTYDASVRGKNIVFREDYGMRIWVI